MGSLEEERSLLEDGLIQNESNGLYTGDGSVDITGKPVLKQSTGNWRACPFILGDVYFDSLGISSCTEASPMCGFIWVQDNAGWGLGFGIPALFMGIAIVSFFSGTPLYRFQKPGGSPVTRMCQVLVASFRKWNLDVPRDSSLLYETQDKGSAIKGSRKLEHSDELKFIVPIARKFTGKERGFSELQRMGIGLFLSVLCMSAAAVVEMKRLQLATELGLVDKEVAVPLSILWQIPQYFLLGAAEIFTFIGQLEFFYDQSPDAMRSLCSALSLLTTSLGNYLSSLILTIVTYFTTQGGKVGWIPDNLNEGHLDYFFWLLAGLSFLNMLVYIVCANRYKKKKAS
ncbi:hypothetical protein Pyn_27264 [Prunus yedoensis var. nudiflora]|uniref:Protein NRT1/ PTR FAMILY 8.3 n=1 Tax=Prunus yedoensis var. nudiflora TaxID=2094558 RepID=A0A314XVQ8_PRUYE|nr:hypothetical protein Pyn_27264 [Prunus yedoensis var. nudiflora]